jgi:predicted phosphoribosyltransferase
MGGERQSDLLIATIAERQHGVVSRRQLRTLGIRDDIIDNRIERARLHLLHRGVFAVGHRRLTREGAWMAAVLAGGDHAALGIRDGGALWAIRAGNARDVDVLVSRDRPDSRAGHLSGSVLRPT